MNNTNEIVISDKSYSTVCWRMTNSAKAMLEETKGYTTGRDEVTIDTIVRAVAFELLQLGLIDVDPEDMAEQ